MTAVLVVGQSTVVSIFEAGDPYEKEFRASAVAVADQVRRRRPYGDHVIAFPGQGMNDMKWLGPHLRAPIGFLADHVEILYDLDIEARSWADELGLTLRRAPSLNASDGLVDALAAVVRSTISRTEGSAP